jgi:hypothetical protein
LITTAFEKSLITCGEAEEELRDEVSEEGPDSTSEKLVPLLVEWGEELSECDETATGCEVLPEDPETGFSEPSFNLATVVRLPTL